MSRVITLFFVIVSIVIFPALAMAGTTDLVSNGEFASGLNDWTPWSNGGGSVDASGGMLNWARYGGSNGNATGATQNLNVDVSGYDSLFFKYSITPTYQTLTAPGWVGGNEYPAVARLNYTDTDDNPGYIATGYSYSFYGGWPTSIPHIELQGPYNWFDYTSPDLMQYIPNIKTVNSIEIYGAGWSYSGSADHVQLLATNSGVVPEPASLSLLGMGLFGAFGLLRKKRNING